jgi:hypothetical protein
MGARLHSPERATIPQMRELGPHAGKILAFINGINVDLRPSYGRDLMAATKAWRESVDPLLRTRFHGTTNEAIAALTAAGKNNPTTLLALGAVIVRDYLDGETYDLLTAPFMTLGSAVAA